jgi:hypothetical protein
MIVLQVAHCVSKAQFVLARAGIGREQKCDRGYEKCSSQHPRQNQQVIQYEPPAECDPPVFLLTFVKPSSLVAQSSWLSSRSRSLSIPTGAVSTRQIRTPHDFTGHRPDIQVTCYCGHEPVVPFLPVMAKISRANWLISLGRRRSISVAASAAARRRSTGR